VLKPWLLFTQKVDDFHLRGEPSNLCYVYVIGFSIFYDLLFERCSIGINGTGCNIVEEWKTVAGIRLAPSTLKITVFLHKNI
jgi:hypothetical protein